MNGDKNRLVNISGYRWVYCKLMFKFYYLLKLTLYLKRNSFPPTSIVNCQLESTEFKNAKNNSSVSKEPVDNSR